MKDTRKRDKLYCVWREMNRRCYSENCCNYSKYGAKGIRVCNEWKRDCDGGNNGFENFYNWAIDNGYKEGLTIDRKNPYEDYTPDNCQWATYNIQNTKLTIKYSNSSGYVGISKDSRCDTKWRARINKKQIGTFLSKKEAVEARNKYIIDHNLNNPIQKWIGEEGYSKETYETVYSPKLCEHIVSECEKYINEEEN